MHERYFQNLDKVLKNSGICQPTLVIDKQRLDQNIDHLKSVVDRGFDYRIVAKSLPSIPMLRYIMERTGTRRLMSFHIPFLIQVAKEIPEADVLLGKPMPISAVNAFYQWYLSAQGAFDQQSQLQWLVDSVERLQEYEHFAKQHDLQLRINLEINVGLNRGGFENPQSFDQALGLLQDSAHLTLSGLMGYEAHITKIPGFLGGPAKAFRKAMARYQDFVRQISDRFGHDVVKDLCLNAGGSTTFPLYKEQGVVNELATASALVKPTDFDVYTLDHLEPAAFIATPILKDVSNPSLPMASGLSALLRKMGLSPKRGLFIYGGNWLASPCYPEKSQRADLLGHSSNQELYEVAANHPIQRDDFMFFRPTQSEALLLQFGELAVMDKGEIKEYWSVFRHPEQCHDAGANEAFNKHFNKTLNTKKTINPEDGIRS
ncbi:alanine racemase [Endozoicomonas ascidiicola]|uniref:alanine racemase n=1 Tax=Endozoicomonas ascidiicola TaxID=1698521 RepID=UPI00082A5DDF|nr:alanine racemase [Endozoicomonas ascidiicola]